MALSPLPAASPDYRWPIRMVWVLMAAVLCSAGATKLIRSGLEWVTSDNFAVMLQQAHYGLKRPGTSMGLWVAGLYLYIMSVMAMAGPRKVPAGD